MASPNTRFQAARERTRSPVYPTECLSREELADQVNLYIWNNHRQRVEIDAGYIGKLERGVIRWPGSRYREAFRAVLEAPTDTDLGFRATRRTTTKLPEANEEPAGIDAAGELPTLLLLANTTPTPIPTTIGLQHIHEVSASARMFVGWQHSHGGWSLREALLAQTRWSARLLRSTCPDNLRGPLCRAIAYLADVCGFMLFDTGDYHEAQRCFRFALACAEEAGDWHRRAIILASMARQALWTGQPDKALTFSEYGLVRADRTPAKQAMLHSARAKALAATGRPEDAIRAVGEADEAFQRTPTDDDPAWSNFYTAAQHAGDTAEAWAGLHATGHRTAEAHTRYTEARDGHGVAYPRSRALAELKLAALVMEAGDPHEAAALGAQALTTARPIRSGRITTLLRTLDCLAARRHNIPAIRNLRHEITNTLGTAQPNVT